MTLQRYSYDLVPVGYDGARIEICTDDNGEWVKASDAEAALAEKDAEIARLRKALEKISEGISEHEYLVMIAREALVETK